MKTLKLTLVSLIALASLAPVFAFADAIETIEADSDTSVFAEYVDGHQQIPAVGDLRGSVLSVYAGSAYALEGYMVTVANGGGICEGDDCIAGVTFRIQGNFNGAAKAVYSRKIDAQTYSIAILTNLVDGTSGEAKYIPGKILLRVKFTAEGVANIAEMTTQKL